MTDQPRPLTEEEVANVEARLQHGATPIDRVVSGEDILRLIAEVRQCRRLIHEVFVGLQVEPMANGRCLWCASRLVGEKEPHEDDCPWVALRMLVDARSE